MTRASGIDDQILSLPAGGGSVSSIGPTFDVDLNTGTASTSVALELPPGPNGVKPEVALRYHSGTGDDLAGLGWTLGMPAITREPRPSPQRPVYILGGVGVLRPFGAEAEHRWRPEVDNLGPMIRSAADPAEGWELVDTSDTTHTLGRTAASQIAGADGAPVMWVLDGIRDAFGNGVDYAWLRDGGRLLPQQIRWGTWQLDFVYEPRPDRLLDGHLGVLLETRLRCARIELRVPAEAQPLVRSWELAYADDAGLGRSQLAAVTIVGHAADGTRLAAPPTRFSYTGIGAARLDSLTGWQPGNLRSRSIDFVDLSGDGLPDAIDLGAGAPAIWRNLGRDRWSGPHRLDHLPSPVRLDRASVSFADMNGDGAADLVVLDARLSGYYPFNTRPWTRPDADAAAAGVFDRPTTWRRAPDFALGSPDVKLLDLNGDALSDLLVDTGRAWLAWTQATETGWAERPDVLPRDATPPVRLRDPRVFTADLTGDGGQDILRLEGGAVRYWPSLGPARWGAARTMAIANAPPGLDPRRVVFADVDGDGCADLVYAGLDRVLVWRNTGADRLIGPIEIRGVPPTSPGAFRLLDLRGTGTLGLLFDTVGAGHRASYLSLLGDTKPYLLSRIDAGTGAVTDIAYRSSTEYALDDRDAGAPWSTFHPFPVHCVAEVVRSDATTGGELHTRYRYRDARFDPASRAFLGFGRVTTDALGDETAPTLRSINEFHVGLDPADPFRALAPEERLALGALRRRPLAITTRGVNADGTEQPPLSITRYAYTTRSIAALDGSTIVVPYTTSTIEERHDGLAALLSTHRVDFLDIDERGTVRQQRSTVTAADGTVARDLYTEATVATGGTNLCLPARAMQVGADGTVFALTIHYYDGPDHVGLPEGEATHGALTRTEDLVLTDELLASVWGTGAPDPAAFGLHRLPGERGWWATRATRAQSIEEGVRVLVSRGGRGARSTVRLDATAQYVASITDARGNTITAGCDRRSGQVARLTDANGATQADEIDALGRVSATFLPGDAPDAPSQLWTYETAALPIRVDAAQRTDPTSAPKLATVTYFDGLGRVLARLTPAGPIDGAPPGSWLVAQAHRFNRRGLVVASWLPYLAADPAYAPPTETDRHVAMAYNAAGQLVREQRPDGRAVIYERGADHVLISSVLADGTARPRERHEIDACGQMTRVSRWDGTRWVSQQHAWDARGRLIRTTTPDGAIIELTYDLMGRPIRHRGPETGDTLRFFDANGSEVLRRNAEGQDVRRDYDALRRPTKVYYGSGATADVTYEYLDASSPAPADGLRNRVGRVWKVRDAIGQLEVAYDAFGRTTSSTRSGTPVPGTFTTDIDYDRLGRITSVVLPELAPSTPRLRVDYTYDEVGRVHSATGVVSEVAYDLWGRVLRMRYANGALTENTYDPVTARLTRQTVTAPDGTVLSDQLAGYDDDGQLASLASGAETTTFAYDGLNRLTGVTRTGGAAESYAYSDGGNMTLGGLGAMMYAPASARLVSAGGRAYTHDAAGRIVAAPYGTLAFDGADRLLSVLLGSGARLEHGYDHVERHALTRRDGALEYLAISEQLELHGGRATLWLGFGGRRLVAVSGGERRWLHPDLRGNVSLISDQAGRRVFSAAYSAYGLLVGGDPTTADGAGFLGAAANEAGLVCLGLRWFDPRLGRFLSPDPMVAGIYVIDAWNPYAYGHNNPIAFVDPSGAWNWAGVLAVSLLVAAIVVAAVFTGGAALVGLSVIASSLSTSTLVAVGIGAFGGALAGGLSAMKAGGSVWGGAFLGGVIGGACALAGGAIGAGITSGLGKTLLGYVLGGAAQGAISGFGTGFVVGFAGGKGTLNAALLAGLRGAIWGAFFGAVLGFGTKVLFIGPVDGNGVPEQKNVFEFGTFNRYVPDAKPTQDPSSFGVWDNSLGTSEDAVFTGSHIANKSFGLADAGDIIDITCVRDIGAEGYAKLGGNLISFGQDGSLVVVDLAQVANGLAGGGIGVATTGSVLLDDNGMSYASQFAMLLKNIPVLGNVLAFADEYKLGWYEKATHGFDSFFRSRTKPE